MSKSIRSKKQIPTFRTLSPDDIQFGTFKEERPPPGKKSSMSDSASIFCRRQTVNGKRTFTIECPKNLRQAFKLDAGDFPAYDERGFTLNLRLADNTDAEKDQELKQFTNWLLQIQEKCKEHAMEKGSKYSNTKFNSFVNYAVDKDGNRKCDEEGNEYSPTFKCKARYMIPYDGDPDDVEAVKDNKNRNKTTVRLFDASTNVQLLVDYDNVCEYIKANTQFPNLRITFTNVVHTKAKGFTIRCRLDQAQVTIIEDEDMDDCPWESTNPDENYIEDPPSDFYTPPDDTCTGNAPKVDVEGDEESEEQTVIPDAVNDSDGESDGEGGVVIGDIDGDLDGDIDGEPEEDNDGPPPENTRRRRRTTQN
mgnify:CR=1 FL=1